VNPKFHVRPAELGDFESAYALGKRTPELRVAGNQDFMDPEEFRWCMTDKKHSVFFVAQHTGTREIIGFVYATSNDMERPYPGKWACLVYMAVDERARREGLGTSLYESCLNSLRMMGCQFVYGWASAGGQIVRFMEDKGFHIGQKYVWVHKELSA
jgi:GNAT superfamily N-acetyltransferase